MEEPATMIERAARALCRSMVEDEGGWRYFQGEAMAVIEALREPTEAMVEAGRWPAEDDGPAACWKAMIDAALSLPAPAEDCSHLSGEEMGRRFVEAWQKAERGNGHE